MTGSPTVFTTTLNLFSWKHRPESVRTANETTQNNKKYLCLYSHFRDKANVVKRHLITEALLRCVLIVPFRGDEECASVVTVLD